MCVCERGLGGGFHVSIRWSYTRGTYPGSPANEPRHARSVTKLFGQLTTQPRSTLPPKKRLFFRNSREGEKRRKREKRGRKEGEKEEKEGKGKRKEREREKKRKGEKRKERKKEEKENKEE